MGSQKLPRITESKEQDDTEAHKINTGLHRALKTYESGINL